MNKVGTYNEGYEWNENLCLTSNLFADIFLLFNSWRKWGEVSSLNCKKILSFYFWAQVVESADDSSSHRKWSQNI